MTSLFDPRLSMAVGVHSQPGVFALLLGSGVSSAANIPTGWGVVTELTSRIAAMRFDEDAVSQARADPEAWWAANISSDPLTYSGLLAELAPSQSGRAALLAEFFTPDDVDLAAGHKVPTAAHHAIAQLVRRGSVRVIITTNFDRLLEQALTAAGVTGAVVLSTDAQFSGAPPLAHPPCVVLKVHGDFADLIQRNTTEELASYSPQLNGLLDRVFSEYGLIISGWSGVSDTALRNALARTGVCRYPTYFAVRGSVAEEAKHLMAVRVAVTINAVTADELFTGLLADLSALDGLRQAPLSTAVKVMRLKTDLLEPHLRIRVHDLIRAEVVAVTALEKAKPLDRLNNLPVDQLPPALDADLTAAGNQCEPLLALLAAGVYYDTENAHLDLWVDTIDRLLDLRAPFSGSYSTIADALRHLPAALAMRTAGAAAALSGNERALAAVLTTPRWTTINYPRKELPAAVGVYEWEMFNQDFSLAVSLPRLAGRSTRWPVSEVFRLLTRPALSNIEPDTERIDAAVDYYEYVAQLAIEVLDGDYFLASGPWIEPLRSQQEPQPLPVEKRLAGADTHIWLNALGLPDEQTLTEHTQRMHEILVDFARRR
jgi:hypothetical protein